MREAGLPLMLPDIRGDRTLQSGSKGVVRAVYPDQWRVDIEAEDGSLLTHVLVIGPYFPELHTDAEAPSHVGYFFVNGMADALCWPMPHRRLLGPQDSPEGASGENQPERRYYHTHHYISRSGQITMRISKDNRLVLETEDDDYIHLDQPRRTITLEAPSVYVGTEDSTRVEVQRDDSIRAFAPLILIGTETGDRIEYRDQAHIHQVTPEWFMGATGQADADGITYLANSFLHLVSTAIKLTAVDSITLDPPRINFGTTSAAQRVILGNLFQTFLNAFLTQFNGHVHTNVQSGGGLSGPPQTPTAMMPDTTLSTIARVSA
jgi:hypothetical protein